ncbi:MAG TPA: c-type cytochrome [Xanthobacteraceae bacterium]|jgi:cytochrome c|nr:c-type cytochrome [Xanthobacteraceae bacterium]
MSVRLIVAVVAALWALSGAARAQDVEKGREAFAACAPCHAPDQNGVGPKLGGVLNRPVASVEGFRYSRAMKNSKVVWDEKSLDAYMNDPQAFVPGNLMPFSGVAEAKTRNDLIAYLETLK